MRKPRPQYADASLGRAEWLRSGRQSPCRNRLDTTKPAPRTAIADCLPRQAAWLRRNPPPTPGKRLYLYLYARNRGRGTPMRSGVESNGLAEIRKGFFAIAAQYIGHTPAPVRRHVLGFQPDGFRQIRNGLIKLVLGASPSAIEMSPDLNPHSGRRSKPLKYRKQPVLALAASHCVSVASIQEMLPAGLLPVGKRDNELYATSRLPPRQSRPAADPGHSPASARSRKGVRTFCSGFPGRSGVGGAGSDRVRPRDRPSYRRDSAACSTFTRPSLTGTCPGVKPSRTWKWPTGGLLSTRTARWNSPASRPPSPATGRRARAFTRPGRLARCGCCAFRSRAG